VITSRAPDTTFTEACYWIINAQPNTFHDTSEIYIYLNTSTTSTMTVYSGKDRRNVTTVVEANGTIPIGAPVRVSINKGAIVVL
jgi:hypothetical protein